MNRWAILAGGVRRGERKLMSDTRGAAVEARFHAKTTGEEAEQPFPLRVVETCILLAPAIKLQAATHGFVSFG